MDWSVAEKPNSVFIFFSNANAFDSLVLDALGALEQTRQFTFVGCVFVASPASADQLRKNIDSVGLDSKRWTFVYPTVNIRMFGRLFAVSSLLLAEILMWKKNFMHAVTKPWDGVIVHSENFLSDHLTLSMVNPERRLLVNLLTEVREHSESRREVLIRRLRQIRNNRRGDCLGSFSGVLAAAAANLFYRFLMPTAFRLITKNRLNRKLVARRFVAGGNCELYVVAHETAERIAGRVPSRQRVSITQLRENSSADELPREHTLLILAEIPGNPQGAQKYTRSLASDLAEAGKIVDIGKILVRPHPKWFEEGAKVCQELVRLGFNAELGRANERLNLQLARCSSVLGVWSSALYQAIGFSSASRVIGLLTPSLVVEPNLNVEPSIGVTWVPQSLFGKMQFSVLAKGDDKSTRAIGGESLQMSEVIARFFIR